MPLGLIALALSVWLGAADPPGKGLAALLPNVSFNPRQRAVSNWRVEAALHLDAPPGTLASVLLGREPQAVSRCVRLNNYWCIKRAGWAGEIAADAEDHVAFASAAEGADVAALLLRRYYVDYGRHSALAIVSHWAPASCGIPAPMARHPHASPADHLAARGIGRTLRARFLATRGRRLAGSGRMRARPSVVPDRLIGARTSTPSIALGLGPSIGLGTQPLGRLRLTVDGLGAASPPPPPQTRCVDEGPRIRAYAAKAAAGIAQGIDADLKLFDDGAPTANLVRLMANMAAVEIGPLAARQALVVAAVEQARLLVTQAAGAAKR